MKLFSLTGLAALSLFALAACGPPPATKDITYGVWQGSMDGVTGRIQFTFIAPDKAEIERLDEKDKKKEEAKWAVAEGRVKVTRKEGELVLKLDSPTIDDEPALRLSSADGAVKIVKL